MKTLVLVKFNSVNFWTNFFKLQPEWFQELGVTRVGIFPEDLNHGFSDMSMGVLQVCLLKECLLDEQLFHSRAVRFFGCRDECFGNGLDFHFQQIVAMLEIIVELCLQLLKR